MRNVEAKFRCAGDELAGVRERALALGAAPAGTLRQVDTYLQVTHGRLKLREQSAVAGTPAGGESGGRAAAHGEPASGAVLIAYGRPDARGARVSDYVMAPISDPAALLAVLRRALGARVRVAKTREVLLLRHTRIHLDTVEGLGDFVELETVVAGPDARRGARASGAPTAIAARAELHAIATGLGLRLEDAQAGSYADLLEGAARASGEGDGR